LGRPVGLNGVVCAYGRRTVGVVCGY
jgi:hypothetical protein